MTGSAFYANSVFPIQAVEFNAGEVRKYEHRRLTTRPSEMRFKLSIEKTLHGKPGTASHVKRCAS